MLRGKDSLPRAEALLRLFQPFRMFFPEYDAEAPASSGVRSLLLDAPASTSPGAVAELELPAETPRQHSELFQCVRDAMAGTQIYYLNRQHEDGYWWFELESNVTMTSEYLMLLHFIGLHDGERDAKFANHILRHQRADGTWALHWGGDGDISTTVEAYFALKLAGLSAEDHRLQRAKDFILKMGGVEKARVFTRIFLAIFGEYDWRAIPSVPVEINLFPPWFPVSIYRMSSWARSTFVPLSLVLDSKPVRPVPESARIRELYGEPGRIPTIMSRELPALSWKRAFVALDRGIKLIEGTPLRIWRRRAIESTEKWVLDHQEPGGDWGGIQPAMVNAVLGLVALGYDVSHETIRNGLAALERFTIEEDDEMRLQACISPVWDTALTALAMLFSGVDKDHPSIAAACRWLVSKQIFSKGDWSVSRPGLEPGGWAFEFENNWYPDVDDTVMVLLVLFRCAGNDSVPEGTLSRGLQWVLGMQGRDGGWGAFDVDNDMKMLNQLPFGDLEAMIDPSTPDITGRVLELLGLMGYPMSHEAVRRAMKFLRKNQEEDGTWWGRWGVNYIYGTSAVLVGLAAIGEDMSLPYVRKAVGWLKENVNSDGGWGECCDSYGDSRLKCHGESTPSQTAWAILALIAAGEKASPEVMGGIRYLIERQNEDGSWDEPYFTGTGFPKHFMIRYHNYRNCFPLMALGRFSAVSGGGSEVLRRKRARGKQAYERRHD